MPLPLERIKGSIPPLLTPFRNGEVDYDAYARLVEMQILEGSHGILVNGTTSEPASLTTEERNRLVTLSVEVARGRVPIVAATGSQAIWETRILTEHAAKAGADALLIVTPYYTRPPQRGMIAYYLEVMKGIDTLRRDGKLPKADRLKTSITGRAVITGNVDVPRQTILDSVRADIPEGSRFSEARLAEAEANLVAMGVFGGVRVGRGPTNPDDGTVPVMVAVYVALSYTTFSPVTFSPSEPTYFLIVSTLSSPFSRSQRLRLSSDQTLPRPADFSSEIWVSSMTLRVAGS